MSCGRHADTPILARQFHPRFFVPHPAIGQPELLTRAIIYSDCFQENRPAELIHPMLDLNNAIKVSFLLSVEIFDIRTHWWV